MAVEAATPSTATSPPELDLRAGGPRAILAAAREVAAELATRAERHDRDATFAHENVDALWAAGLGNLTVPVELGGVGVDLRTASEAVRLVAAGDASTAIVLVMHLISIRLLTAPDGGVPEPLVRAVVESSLAGPALVNALRVEPELGTPARGGVPATRAELEIDAHGASVWRLNGHKIYSTGIHGLGWLLVWTATSTGDVGFVLVPGDAPGIEIRDTWDHLGMRASASHDVLFHDVVVPVEHAFGLAEPGTQPTGGRDAETAGWLTVLLLSVYQGAARAARDWLLDYLNERTPSNLGASLATLPRFQTAVGEIETLLGTSERLVDGLARDLESGGSAAREAVEAAPATKVVVTRSLIEAVGSAVALVGNPGLSYHHPLQRHYRDVLCSRIHTPQEDSVLLAAGRQALAAGPQMPPA